MAAYIAQLTPMEQKILKIAASHLETSFSLYKSIGYQEWQAAQPKEQAEQQKEQAQQQKEQPKEQKKEQPKEQQKEEEQPKPQEKIIIMVKKKLKPTPH